MCPKLRRVSPFDQRLGGMDWTLWYPSPCEKRSPTIPWAGGGPVSHCSPAKHYHGAQAAQQAAGVVNHIPHKPQNVTGGVSGEIPGEMHQPAVQPKHSQSSCPRRGCSCGLPEAGVALLLAHSLQEWPGHGVPPGSPHGGEGAASLGTMLEGKKQLNALEASHHLRCWWHRDSSAGRESLRAPEGCKREAERNSLDGCRLVQQIKYDETQ